MADRGKSDRAEKPDRAERPEKLDVPQGTLELMILTILGRSRCTATASRSASPPSAATASRSTPFRSSPPSIVSSRTAS